VGRFPRFGLAMLDFDLIQAASRTYRCRCCPLTYIADHGIRLRLRHSKRRTEARAKGAASILSRGCPVVGSRRFRWIPALFFSIMAAAFFFPQAPRGAIFTAEKVASRLGSDNVVDEERCILRLGNKSRVDRGNCLDIMASIPQHG
jgi:hypothetical protein